jgi:hypothetical protein
LWRNYGRQAKDRFAQHVNCGKNWLTDQTSAATAAARRIEK